MDWSGNKLKSKLFKFDEIIQYTVELLSTPTEELSAPDSIPAIRLIRSAYL